MDLTMERFLAWKILPRCMMAAFTLMAWNVCDWFMALGPDATTQQTAFVSTIVGAATGALQFGSGARHDDTAAGRCGQSCPDLYRGQG